METPQLTRTLCSLLQLDFDALRAYDQVLGSIDDKAVYEEFVMFHDEHEQHLDELAELLRDLGSGPPALSRQIENDLFRGFQSSPYLGTGGALEVMHRCEQITSMRYRELRLEEYPEYVRALLEKHRMDEERHLRYIERMMKELAVVAG